MIKVTKMKQLDENMKLSVKLADFLAKHPKAVALGASVVPFSAYNQDLNRENEKLVESLKDEGKKVVKAEETKSDKTPWKFEQVSV